MSHPLQTSAADPSALLGAQVSPIFFCFTILRGFANVVFFFDIFISYYLRYDKVKKKIIKNPRCKNFAIPQNIVKNKKKKSSK